MTRTIAIVQCHAKLQEVNQLLVQVEIVQKKEAVLKDMLGPWLDEAYLVLANIYEKLVNFHLTQQKIK